jgi:hypothetical protein
MMSGFAELPNAIALNEVPQPIQADETAFAEETFDDTTALGLVLNDANEAISYLQSKSLMPTGVDNADDLVRAYVTPRKWSDGKARANMPMFVVLEAIEKILPTLYLSLFGSGKKRPFEVEPVGKTTPDAARAKASVLYWAIKQAGLKEEMRRTLKTILTYGFGVGFWGWESKTIRKRFTTREGGAVKREWKEIQVNVPTYETLALKNVLVDPKCDRQDIQKGAGYIIKQVMVTANQLDSMRADTDTFKNIPTRDELRVILSQKSEPTEDTLTTNKRAVWREFQAELDSKQTSADPLAQPLEYLEYWTADRVIGVLQRKIVIRNQGNEFAEIPGVSCAFVDILGSAWGFGIARLLSGEQRFQTGVANNWIDSLQLILNPVYQLLKGIGPGTQNIQISPGKVVTESGELKPLITPDVSGPALNAIATSEQRASKRVAANGGANLPDQALRTGTGVQALTGDVVQRLQYFLEIFTNLIYIPVLEKFLYLCSEKLEPEQINYILTEEEGKAWEGDITDIYNAEVSIDVIAGANLSAKFAAAALAPQLIQTVSSGPVAEQLEVQGQYFDYNEFVKEAFELQGWDVPSLFKPMTPEMKQAVQQKNAALQKVQGDMALQQQKHSNDMELANEKGTVQAGVSIVKQAAKTHLDVAQNALNNLNQGAGLNGQG